MGAMHPIMEEPEFDTDEAFRRDEPTLCVECDLVHNDTRSKPPYQWRCMAHPAPPFGGFVDPNYRPDPPYHKCQDANRWGICPHWTPRKQPKEQSDD